MGGVDDVIGNEILGEPMSTRHGHFIMAHFEIPIRHGQRWHGPNPLDNKRLRCKLCDRRMKGKEIMLDHLKSYHHLEIPDWEEEVRSRCKDGFEEFIQAGLALGDARLFARP